MARQRRARTDEEKERDPKKEQRGGRGARPGKPDPSGLEERMGLLCDLAAQFVMSSRYHAALKPASAADGDATLMERELARTFGALMSIGRLRTLSRERLLEGLSVIEATSLRCFQRIFRGLGEDGRLWWANRKADVWLAAARATIGQPMPVPNGAAPQRVTEKRARAMVASWLGANYDERTVRLLPEDPIAFRHAGRRPPKK